MRCVVMMGKPQRRAIGSASKAGALLGRGARWQRRKAHFRLADMRIGTGIADLMVDTAGHRTHRGGGRFQELLICVIMRHEALAGGGLADRRLCQVNPKAALVIFGHCRAFNLVTFIQEAHPEGQCHIVEDQGVFRPGDDGSW